MVNKFVSATELRKGSYAIINDAPCIIKNIDISKTGKHGHAKVRIEALGLIDNKKRIIIKPGNDRIAVPLIEKRRAQVLNVDDKVNIMDIESYETFEVIIPDELRETIKSGCQVEYWNIEGVKIIKRLL